MTMFFSLFVALLVFFVGLRLSGFFSGSETGFYRVSTLQLTLQKQRGDAVGSRLYYFVNHPERFVATTLVGNNVANYLTTLAIGMMVTVCVAEASGALEIVATLMMTPVIFIFGELIPKSLYYRAPMQLLRNGSLGFSFCYYCFLPISYPLIVVSRLVSKLGSSDKRPMEIVFGRTRLYGVLEEGQKEGILTGLQRNLAENLMQVAEDPVSLAMVPASVVPGTRESSSFSEVMEVARRTESPYVLMHDDQQRYAWTSFVRIADVHASNMSPRLVKQLLPAFDANTPRIEVLTQLMEQRMPLGRVTRDGRTIGIIRRQTLVSQLFRVMRPATHQLDSLTETATPEANKPEEATSVDPTDAS